MFLIREGKKETLWSSVCVDLTCVNSHKCKIFLKSCVRARNGLTCEDAFSYKPGSVSLIHGCEFRLHKDGRS